MTRIGQIAADWISAGSLNARHPRSVPSLIWTRPGQV